MRKIFWS